MKFRVECYENQRAFGPHDGRPAIIQSPESAAWAVAQPNLLVGVFDVEAHSAVRAADAAFEIANAPWQPSDLNGATWRHDKVRSMSSGDNVIVHTPDGMVGYTCLFLGWQPFRPSDMNIADPSIF